MRILVVKLEGICLNIVMKEQFFELSMLGFAFIVDVFVCQHLSHSTNRVGRQPF